MNDLSKDLLVKIKSLYQNKKYSKLETTLENLKNLEGLPNNLQMIYAVSKALNPKSKINDYKKSALFFEKIYLKDKSNLEPLYNLIIVSLKANMHLKLKSLLEDIYKQQKKDPKILEGLSKTNFFLGNMTKATFYYKELINLRPNYINDWTKFLGSVNYHQNISQNDYLKYCKKFDKLLKPEGISNEKPLKKNTKITLGFFSSDFKKHSVSFFLKGILNRCNEEKFKLVAFSNLSPTNYDELTEELKKNFHKWCDISNLSDEDFIKLSIENNIDILIDLAGFTNGNRINVFRARCAPIQISWLGYCNTLGIKNMDYLISDKNLIKENEENLYSEKIIYMPQIWNTLDKPKKLPEINFNILKEKTFTFGSLSNFQKISNQSIKVWSKILNNSNSKLILKSSINNSEDLKKNLLEKFIEQNVAPDKIIIFDRVEKQSAHLEFYNKFSLTLDTFPYPGVTTSFESVLMGRPFLTMEGNNFNSRCGESINRNLKLDEFIAKDEDDYYDKAIALCNNPKKLNKLSESLRNKTLNSPLYDLDSFSKDFYSTLNKIYVSH
jgi:protein O-GlcNAc transferase